MHPRHLQVALAVALPVCAACQRSQVAQGSDAAAATAANDSISLDTIATGLDVPWALAFAPPPDGRIFVTERPGRIRIIEHGHLLPVPWATLPVTAVGEAGLMGLALAPDFAISHAVYVVGTFTSAGRLINRVVRLVERERIGRDAAIIVDNIPAAEFHAGDAVAFGPDGMLYIGTGDAQSPGSAQDANSLAGKILRYTRDGRVPEDNPIRSSPVYALGLRNVQGLAWDSATGQLFATDHGPSGFLNERFRRDHDELNAVRPGANYGWPAVVGKSDDRRFVPPLAAWTPAIAPSGLAVYAGSDFPAWHGSLFVGALRGQHLRRLTVVHDPAAPAGWRVAAEAPLFLRELGRIRAVAYSPAPDGHLYFTTSNRDGRGDARRNDDRVVRLVRAR